ncbi:MAG: hypothetical protein IPK82_10565 [Polyangiaceae bacterium]|nr:hypothetical protein [Polyangiaceae bacterium]
MTKHARFLQIESGETHGPSSKDHADRGRIAAVLNAAPPPQDSLELAPEQPAGSGEPVAWPDRVQTLGMPDSEVNLKEAPIELDSSEGQPFVQCVHCGADSAPSAVTCVHCAQELDTPAQRRHNELVWAKRQEERRTEREALAQLAEARRVQAEAARSLYQSESSLPPELVDAPNTTGPLLLPIVRLVPGEQGQWIVGALVFLVPTVIIIFGGSIGSWIGRVLLFFAMLTLLPQKPFRGLMDAIGRRRSLK